LKDKIKSIISNIGGQIETYSPLVSSTGYVISRLEVKLLFGLLPSITPFVTKISEPDIHQMIGFLKGMGGDISKLVTDGESLISKLEEIEQKVLLLEERLNQARAGASAAVSLADGLQRQVQSGGLQSLLENPEYKVLIQDAILLLASNVKSPILGKLLTFVARSIGSQSVSFKGYEMKEFSIDLGVLPSVSFALVKV